MTTKNINDNGNHRKTEKVRSLRYDNDNNHHHHTFCFFWIVNTQRNAPEQQKQQQQRSVYTPHILSAHKDYIFKPNTIIRVVSAIKMRITIKPRCAIRITLFVLPSASYIVIVYPFALWRRTLCDEAQKSHPIELTSHHIIIWWWNMLSWWLMSNRYMNRWQSTHRFWNCCQLIKFHMQHGMLELVTGVTNEWPNASGFIPLNYSSELPISTVVHIHNW